MTSFSKVLLFITQGLSIHGKNWKKIEKLIGTRNGPQIRSHAQKFFQKLEESTGRQPQIHEEVSEERKSNSNYDTEIDSIF